MTYKEAIIEALNQLNGHAYLKDIYVKFLDIYKEPLPKNWKSNIRATIEDNSSSSERFKNGEDLFYSVEGLGNGHWGLKNFIQSEAVELTQDDDEFSEGKVLLKQHLQRERNVRLIETAKKEFVKKHGHLYCEICGFDFFETYGELGENFIEAHHIKPVSEMKEGEKTRIEDIVMVCSNCHSMIHRKKPWVTLKGIKEIINHKSVISKKS